MNMRRTRLWYTSLSDIHTDNVNSISVLDVILFKFFVSFLAVRNCVKGSSHFPCFPLWNVVVTLGETILIGFISLKLHSRLDEAVICKVRSILLINVLAEVLIKHWNVLGSNNDYRLVKSTGSIYAHFSLRHINISKFADFDPRNTFDSFYVS